jgi:predicted RNase H-like HicB family nuclease
VDIHAKPQNTGSGSREAFFVLLSGFYTRAARVKALKVSSGKFVSVLILPMVNMMKQNRKFTVVIERDEERYYVATVPTLRGCHTQAKTLDTLMKRVREAIEVCLGRDDDQSRSLELVGIQQISL